MKATDCKVVAASSASAVVPASRDSDSARRNASSLSSTTPCLICTDPIGDSFPWYPLTGRGSTQIEVRCIPQTTYRRDYIASAMEPPQKLPYIEWGSTTCGEAGASVQEAEGHGSTIVMVDDHPAVTRGIELLLRRFGHHVVGVADRPETGYAMVEARRPDVAIVDLQLPDENGAQLTRRLLQRDPDQAVLLYTGAEDRALLGEALDCGARGFALKSAAPGELAEAVRSVARGGTYMDPRLRALVLSWETTETVGLLSPREREILDGLARGLSGEQLATQLEISPETVRTHVRNAMEKLEAHTRAHAVVIALQ